VADEGDGDKKEVTFYRLEDLEVTEVALVDRPAIGIDFLVLKRLSPDGQPAAAGEEGKAMTKRNKAAGDGQAAEEWSLPPEVLRTLKGMGAALGSFLPEDAPESDEVCAAARVFQAAAEKASEDTSKEEPMDFRSAWEGMVVADQMWKCFMTMETVVTNIARSDKTPDEKAGLFDTAITDFATVARELLGLAKAAPAPAEGEGETGDGDGAPNGDTSESADDPANEEKSETDAHAVSDDLGKQVVTALAAIPDLLTEVRELGDRLDKVEAGNVTPEAPATDGAADTKKVDTSSDERPVTAVEMQKAIEAAIQAARHPVFKSRIPKQEPVEGGEGDEHGAADAQPTGPIDRTERRKRLQARRRDLNATLLAAQGIPQVEG
jgi:hypothetical protein